MVFVETMLDVGSGSFRSLRMIVRVARKLECCSMINV
jgi:hypothetical protein